MGQSNEELREEVHDCIREINRILYKQVEPLWLKLDLSMAQIKAMWIVANNEPVTISQVSEALGVGLSTASHLVDKLVNAGIVDRKEDTTDRRRALVRLSAQGHDTVEWLRQGNRAQMQEWLSQLEPEDLHALFQGTRALREIMGRSQPSQAAPDAALAK